MKKLFLLTLLVAISSSLFAQVRQVNGVVTDKEDGSALPGVNVTVKGDNSNGAVTDADGKFSLQVNGNDAVLVFNFIGYKQQEVIVGAKKEINVVLESSMTGLDEVVVVGYGTKKKINVTGAVSSVNVEKAIGERPVSSISSMFQGTLAGVTISTNNTGGEPGSTQNINIRGYSGSPYILLDGMPISSAELNAINPNDIESMTTLKDAASAAIYGSKGAYGVILITSKSGKKGKTKVNFTSNYALSSISVMPKPANSWDFANAMNQAAANSGQAPAIKDDMMELLKQQMEGTLGYQTKLNEKGDRWESGYANTDWYDLFFKDNAVRKENNLSVSGGTDKTTFYFSGGLLDTEGQLNFGNNTYDRKNIKAKVTHTVNKWLKFDVMSAYSKEKKVFPSGGFGKFTSSIIYHQLSRAWPNAPAYDPDGNVISGHIKRLTDAGQTTDVINTYNNKLSATITPIKDWNTKITYQQKNKHYSMDRQEFNALIVYPDGTFRNQGYSPEAVMKRYGENEDKLFTITSSYKKTLFDRHNLSALVGYESRREDISSLYGYRDKLMTKRLPVITLATGEQKASDNVATFTSQGMFTRIGYDYSGIYLLEFNARRDGSSYFRDGEKWGFFPSFSAGYNISKEKFWKPLEDIVSSLKLRFSWGALGDHNRKYASKYVELMTGGRELGWIQDGKKMIYTTSPSIVDPSLTWETVTTTNYGIDAAFFDNRLSVVAEYFISEKSDIIVASEILPSTFGAAAPKWNYAATETKGWDLDVKWQDEIGEFKYSVGFNITDSKRTISKWYNPDGLSSTYSKGDVVGDIWGYETVGYFKSQEEIDAAPDQTFLHAKWSVGDVQYKDLNDDGKIDNGDGTVANRGDRKILGNNRDRYKYGINMSASYKGFSLSVLLQGVAKKDYLFSQSTNLYYGFRGNKWQNSVTKASTDYWTPENTDAFFPKPYMTGEHLKNTKPQSKYVEDASYMRLKNIQLNYSLPQSIVNKIGLSKFMVYVSGENLALFTKLNENFDPETLGGGWGAGKIFPLSKTVSAGVKISF